MALTRLSSLLDSSYVGTRGLIVGEITLYAGSSAPAGWSM